MFVVNRYRCKRNPLLSIHREYAQHQLHHNRVHCTAPLRAHSVAHAVVVVVRGVISARTTGPTVELRHRRLRARATLEVSVATDGREGGGAGSEVMLGECVKAGMTVS